MRTIHTGNSSYLSQICKEVERDNLYVKGLIEEMNFLMITNRGIGIAAPQVGELLRIILVHVDSYKQVFINPKITRVYGGKFHIKEGCLSYPGLIVPMVRHRHVTIEGFDPNWKPIKRKLKLLTAACVQHEVDHLDGITIGEVSEQE